jgi:hypothetical protein
MGIYRHLLACCVVVEHLSGNIPSLTHTGMFAVVGFYVLSGYLITRVLNDVYGVPLRPVLVEPNPSPLFAFWRGCSAAYRICGCSRPCFISIYCSNAWPSSHSR